MKKIIFKIKNKLVSTALVFAMLISLVGGVLAPMRISFNPLEIKKQEANAAWLAGYSYRKKVTITGHTDDVGEASSNHALGLNRANTVQDYLVSKGILADKVNTTSKGEIEPIDTNETEEGRAKNRRIIVKIE